MAIRYHINKSKLNSKITNVGRVDLKGSFTREMLIDRMLEMGSSVTRADILAVVNNFEQAIKNICLEGNKVTLEGFCQFTPTIGGTFEHETDGFDSTRNEIYITSQISASYNRDFAQKAVMEKITVDQKKPILLEVVNVADKKVNTNVKVNGIVTISGESLKFDETSTDEYLRFINADNPNESVKITQIQKVTDKEIVFLFPQTTILEGCFEVASRMDTATLKTGRTSFNVTVNQ